MNQVAATRRKAFLPQLLDGTTDEKIAYFQEFLVTHANLNAVDKEVWNGINAPGNGTLFFVIGPTGVGKTTLRRSLERRLVRDAVRLNGKSGSPPFLSAEVPACEGNHFKWGDFFRTALKSALGPPPKGMTASPLTPNQQAIFVKRAHQEFHFRDQLLDWFLEHRPKAFFIDETQHLSHTYSLRRLLDHMDVLKSFANLAQTTIVLFGTYDLLACRDLSAQLSRRSVDIHFKRYGRRPVEVRSFLNVILTFMKHLPLRSDFNLLEHSDFLYVHSAGCVGILKDWLTRALRAAWLLNDGVLTSEILRNEAPCASKAHRIGAESIAGETKWETETVSSEQLYRLLGVPLPPNESDAPAPPISSASNPRNWNARKDKDVGWTPIGEANAPNAKINQTIKAKPNLPRPIGKRKPTRDPIGQG